jgi:hypothetical protein
MNNASLNPATGVQRDSDKPQGTVTAGRPWPAPAASSARQSRVPAARASMELFAKPRIERSQEAYRMKAQKRIQAARQPEPFTPGMTKGMVREHAQKLFDQSFFSRDPLTLDDWVMAERDLVGKLQKDLS